MPLEKLAGFHKNGKIWYAQGIEHRDLVPLKRHMVTAKREILKETPYTTALERANRAERCGMTLKQFQQHNGRLGALARELPYRYSYKPKRRM